MDKSFRFDSPSAALEALAQQLSHVEIESGIDVGDATGRVLASDVIADRDSPAANVSAMDGYAITMADLQNAGSIPIGGESAPGNPPPEMSPGAVVRIFTGAIVPRGADAVIKREDTEESEDSIRIADSGRAAQRGEHIRHAGENAPSGSTVLEPGIRISAAHRATMANFGCQHVDVFAPVRVAIITTGDEVGSFENETPQPWQLRNSNRASLASLLDELPWVSVHSVDHCIDDREQLESMVGEKHDAAHAVLLTGGVSMGNYDHVPDVIRAVGGEVVFHGLPIRPGKPILAAASRQGKLLMGLPGNPVSATIGCRRMAMPALARLSGQSHWQLPSPLIQLRNAGERSIPLRWLRLVRATDDGSAEPVFSQGSGDLVSLGQSTGFVEIPRDQSGEGPWPYFAW